MSEVLTSNSRPKCSATLTVRIIKSFQYRTERSLVLHELNLEQTTVADLKNIARNVVLTQPAWKPYRSVVLGPPLSLSPTRLCLPHLSQTPSSSTQRHMVPRHARTLSFLPCCNLTPS